LELNLNTCKQDTSFHDELKNAAGANNMFLEENRVLPETLV